MASKPVSLRKLAAQLFLFLIGRGSEQRASRYQLDAAFSAIPLLAFVRKRLSLLECGLQQRLAGGKAHVVFLIPLFHAYGLSGGFRMGRTSKPRSAGKLAWNRRGLRPRDICLRASCHERAYGQLFTHRDLPRANFVPSYHAQRSSDRDTGSA